jgi:hypothetical protein
MISLRALGHRRPCLRAVPDRTGGHPCCCWAGRKGGAARSRSASTPLSATKCTTPGVVRVALDATELLGADLCARHLADHARARDVHLPFVPTRIDEVGQRRRVCGATRARPADDGDLRNEARRLDVAIEDVAIAGRESHPLLDARATGVVHEDDRIAGLDRVVLQLVDLACRRLADSAASHGEVLARRIHGPTITRP